MIHSIKDIEFGTRYHPVITRIHKYEGCTCYKFSLKDNGVINIPEKCGVYILEFQQGIYIGQSTNLCKRINSHIANLLFKDLSNIQWYKDVVINKTEDMNLYIIETIFYEDLERYLLSTIEDVLLNTTK